MTPFYLALILLVVALVFFLISGSQRKQSGLPGGRIIYTDTRLWGEVEKPLYNASLGLTGKPDYLVKQGDRIIPVEVKTGHAPEAPYDSHIFQLAAYCLLVESTSGKRPPYGIIHYPERDFAIDYTIELESALLDLLAEIRRAEARREVPRSHEDPQRCARCGFRSACDQRLG
jgi:CRISPR-associated exonuclease Cas4